MKPSKKLLQTWYKKLKSSGFVDIEKDENTLIEYHSTSFHNKNRRGGFEEKARYYELASQLLHTFPFTSTASKSIWKLHASGMSVDAIAKELRIDRRLVMRSIQHVAGHIKYVNHEID